MPVLVNPVLLVCNSRAKRLLSNLVVAIPTCCVEYWYRGIDVSGVSQPVMAASEQSSRDVQLCQVVRGRGGLCGCREDSEGVRDGRI